MNEDRDMMMLRFKTAINRELSRSDDAAAKPARPDQVTAAPRTPPRTQAPATEKPGS